MKFTKSAPLRGQLTVPGDKSISHRGIMLGSIAKGTTQISHFLPGADCLSTISCFRKMGIPIEHLGDTVRIRGNGLRGLKPPEGILDCGNSGTTIRLISGILAAQTFDAAITGDSSIQKRPMRRIMTPLSMMGADLKSLEKDGFAPLLIKGSPLHGIRFDSKISSAQVKSAILLAGLYAEGETRVTEPYVSRNHSEIMMTRFGADVKTVKTTAVLTPAKELYGCHIAVPGDISSAAPFIAAGLLVPGSELLLRHVGVNPTRAGFLHVCRQMGGDISLVQEEDEWGEPAADLLIKSSRLHAAVIEGAIIPTLIDELPMIAAMACFAEGTTVIRDAAELKVKESNRIRVMVTNLKAMGADVTETEDGMIIAGGKPLKGALIDSRLDHRIAMTFAVTGLCAKGETEITGAECVTISYPGFYDDLRSCMK